MFKIAQIKVGNGTATVDAADYSKLAKYEWHKSPAGYAVRSQTIAGKELTIFMHDQIMHPKAGQTVHHKDNNGMHNERSNLEIVSKSKNTSISPKRSDNTSGTTDVFFRKDRNKWQGKVMIEGKRKVIGLFDTEAQAASAVANYKKQHGLGG